MDNIAILQALYDDVQAYADAHGGQAAASGTFVESLEILSARPSGFLAVVEWQGEDAASDDEWAGVMRNDIGIYVAINAGLQAKPGAALWLSPSGRTLLERTNAVRDRVREIVFTDNEDTSRRFNYRGAKQVLLPDGTPLRAFRLEFQIHNALPEPEYRNVNP
ncbi:MAG: hypothetical protein WCS65_16450 [Verrucomicrobiae bacterium]